MMKSNSDSFWGYFGVSLARKSLETRFSEEKEDWQDETGVKLVAVSIDDSRSMAKVAPMLILMDWEYEVYLDSNSDLKRAMEKSTVPHTFLLNNKKECLAT